MWDPHVNTCLILSSPPSLLSSPSLNSLRHRRAAWRRGHGASATCVFLHALRPLAPASIPTPPPAELRVARSSHPALRRRSLRCCHPRGRKVKRGGQGNPRLSGPRCHCIPCYRLTLSVWTFSSLSISLSYVEQLIYTHCGCPKVAMQVY